MTSIQLELSKPYGLFFQALANPIRIRIVQFLKDAKTGSSVSKICGELKLEQSQVSHALRCLAFCGIVTSLREGKSMIYKLNGKTMVPMLDLVEAHVEKYASNLYACDALER
ncbi:MAG: ArsR/SmtB family transcription factor [Nitrososphaerales archaeon]